MGSVRPDVTVRAVVWGTLCVIVTAAFVGCYVVAQQSGRSGVDDVPRAMAARAAQQLSDGATPAQVVGTPAADLASERSPFLIVYNHSDQLVASGATLAGDPPILPSGVLRVAANNGENRVTWQPMAGVREAVVALPWRDGGTSGVVVAGASLQPAEARSHALLAALAAAWLALILAITVRAAWLGGRAARVRGMTA